MTQYEKVCSGIEHCLKYDSSGKECNKCPYDSCGTDAEPLFKDALSLIRQQQKEIESLKKEPIPPKCKSGRWVCGSCGHEVDQNRTAMFCSYCGNSVRWFSYK